MQNNTNLSTKIPPGIIEFADKLLYQRKPEWQAYEDWVTFYLNQGYTFHTIEVKGKQWSVGDETTYGKIIEFYCLDDAWMYNTDRRNARRLEWAQKTVAENFELEQKWLKKESDAGRPRAKLASVKPINTVGSLPTPESVLEKHIRRIYKDDSDNLTSLFFHFQFLFDPLPQLNGAIIPAMKEYAALSEQELEMLGKVMVAVRDWCDSLPTNDRTELLQQFEKWVISRKFANKLNTI